NPALRQRRYRIRVRTAGQKWRRQTGREEEDHRRSEPAVWAGFVEGVPLCGRAWFREAVYIRRQGNESGSPGRRGSLLEGSGERTLDTLRGFRSEGRKALRGRRIRFECRCRRGCATGRH